MLVQYHENLPGCQYILKPFLIIDEDARVNGLISVSLNYGIATVRPHAV